MSNTQKHTPGPWFIDESGWIEGPNCAVICMIDDGGVVNFTAVDAANARLIAAAPELLEALERALPELEDTENDMIARKLKWTVAEQARAAIAKAKGETQ